ncbi:MAG: ATP-binding protein [Oligoflexus sp.]
MWIQREISKKIATVAKQFPALVLTGARQVGKTSLLKRLFPHHNFVTLDLPSLSELAENEPERFLAKYPPPVVIDEVQYAPNLFRYLKLHIDQHRHLNGQIIMTGSQKFTLMKGVSESLAGRCAVLELESLSSFEITSALKLDAPNLFSQVFHGGFPQIYAGDEVDREIYMQSYVATYLERDVRSLLNIGQLRDFERFIRACAYRSGQVLNKADLARDIGISAPTANEWLSVLQASNQIVLLEPWFNNKTKSLIKSPKIYFQDTGLQCFLLNLNSETEMLESPFWGNIFESFVFSEMRKRFQANSGKWDIWFWRDLKGLEVDYLIPKGGRYQLIEVKTKENPISKDFDNLERVSQLLGPELVEKILVCRTANSHLNRQHNVQVVHFDELWQFLKSGGQP